MELDLARLRAFTLTVELGSLDAAARELHVTPSAVSQRIRALEIDAGRVLLVRGRPATATEAGAELLRLGRQFDALVADASARLAEEGPSTLPIAVNADSLASWVLPALAPLRGEVRFEFHTDDQEHTSTHLRTGAVMAAIASDPEPVQGCTSVPLGVMRYRLCASPDFAARWFPDGGSPAEFAVAPFVEFNRKDALQRRHVARVAPDARPPRHVVPGSFDFVKAVRLGFGWGFIPDVQIAPDDERLVEVGDPADRVDVALHWHQWRIATPALDATAEAIRAAARRVLSEPPAATRRATS